MTASTVITATAQREHANEWLGWATEVETNYTTRTGLRLGQEVPDFTPNPDRVKLVAVEVPEYRAVNPICQKHWIETSNDGTCGFCE